jgi:hypothetical protein
MVAGRGRLVSEMPSVASVVSSMSMSSMSMSSQYLSERCSLAREQNSLPQNAKLVKDFLAERREELRCEVRKGVGARKDTQ